VRPEADGEWLRSFLGKWIDAMHAGDVDTLASMFTDDAVRLAPNGSPVIGKAAIQRDFQEYFDEFKLIGSEEYSEFHVSCDFMIARGSWVYEETPKAGGDTVKSNGYMMDIFKRQPDGSWKLYWNAGSDELLVFPMQPQE
jgi:uncharacterized protein (TIGR02246 family)